MKPINMKSGRRVAAFQRFFHLESTGGIILLITTFVAIAIANSPFHDAFQHLLHTEITIGFGEALFQQSLHFWINDGLMSIFFFVVGLEIKREIMVGELSSSQKALLPIGAAFGGMIFPVLFFMVVVWGKPYFSSWGIPMATDIAFSLGILALLGSRIPVALKVFLTALAIVDDIGATLMISIFHSDAISWVWLAISGGVVLSWLLIRSQGITNLFVYMLIGLIFWIAFLNTGVHPTISGVIYAMVVPVKTRINTAQFVSKVKARLNKFEQAGPLQEGTFATKEQREALTAIEESAEAIRSPLQRLEHALHTWVVFFIMPVFALANAGIRLEGEVLGAFTHPLFIGIFLGLFVGKQVGIFGISWLMVKTNIAQLNKTLTWRQVYGAGCLAGIGFTMAIFIGNVSIEDATLLAVAKLAIITASVFSGALGYYLLRTATPKPVEEAQ